MNKVLDTYSQFRNFHVFKRFKYLLSDWWNIDILVLVKNENKFFYDSLDHIYNPVVKRLLESSLFKNHFLSSLNSVIGIRYLNPNPKLVSWKQTGLDLFVVPLNLKEHKSRAFLVATGFSPKKEKELKSALLYLGLSDSAVEKSLQNLKHFSSADEVYVQRMLRILSEEFFTLLQEKKKQEKIIKKLSQNKANNSYGELLGQSPAMQYIFNVLEKLKNYDSNLLIEGEHGTEKQLLAKTIHLQSSRADKAFYVQNFSSFQGRLLELEFFGYKKKAVPSSRKDKKALLEKLAGGTVFLNDIENTSLLFQEKLLKFLKEGEFISQGDTKIKKTNVRVIVASSKDLKLLIKEGQFNEDLYFAISAMIIKIPPLKHRKEDIPLLIQRFLKVKKDLGLFQFSSEALKALYNYSWPGNIKELESEMARFVPLAKDGQHVFSLRDLSPHIRSSSSKWIETLQGGETNLKKTLRSFERQILLDCLKKNNWNKSHVAKLLGTSRTSIVLKTKEYGIIKEEGA